MFDFGLFVHACVAICPALFIAHSYAIVVLWIDGKAVPCFALYISLPIIKKKKKNQTNKSALATGGAVDMYMKKEKKSYCVHMLTMFW